ncbi:hypothetical protein ACS0TY_008034 [Phlomoides rotata]
MIFKVDFEKANYDIVWSEFVDDMLDRMKFYKRWRRWIHSCTSFFSHYVSVGGLRQTYLISSFLFLIAVEGGGGEITYNLLLSWVEFRQTTQRLSSAFFVYLTTLVPL